MYLNVELEIRAYDIKSIVDADVWMKKATIIYKKIPEKDIYIYIK